MQILQAVGLVLVLFCLLQEANSQILAPQTSGNNVCAVLSSWFKVNGHNNTHFEMKRFREYCHMVQSLLITTGPISNDFVRLGMQLHRCCVVGLKTRRTSMLNSTHVAVPDLRQFVDIHGGVEEAPHPRADPPVWPQSAKTCPALLIMVMQSHCLPKRRVKGLNMAVCGLLSKWFEVPEQRPEGVSPQRLFRMAQYATYCNALHVLLTTTGPSPNDFVALGLEIWRCCPVQIALHTNGSQPSKPVAVPAARAATGQPASPQPGFTSASNSGEGDAGGVFVPQCHWWALPEAGFPLPADDGAYAKLLARILKAWSDIGIKVGLQNGSLLGAYRHHGFLPGDRDVDMQMPVWQNWQVLAPHRQCSRYVVSGIPILKMAELQSGGRARDSLRSPEVLSGWLQKNNAFDGAKYTLTFCGLTVSEWAHLFNAYVASSTLESKYYKAGSASWHSQVIYGFGFGVEGLNVDFNIQIQDPMFTMAGAPGTHCVCPMFGLQNVLCPTNASSTLLVNYGEDYMTPDHQARYNNGSHY
jgi:hypothetical protein|uniref:LicD/FKTN/FKRP nucleotidyltransferase domain-containing protein n=1 Tax=Eutreptiella gymnastica TaxID=73025 RepID=A0A7S4GAK0_9EUGL|mmetsp:Transcript_46728/g.78444  ORF Transcript_46728/g.78444 Transcript_46728/m.78444 type:complete len:527 (-) Transcript_46728:426-2006(-)|eukprot:CAMPEP_0174298804 /NCGR_PEP_ID=MMETSP0809-20121228/54882_1 /TAXON_ID=73025 ORGANISM="Eutreptiella gymnastica-like, Strain CCMP1594" /NCGR_SAMPLE_ID=MMETSP0809 /ASSEMBLY_ACC=CAM_ASM_000658 /LENGTH=526 /DNA_ID=CAMNT_0015403529 /DNA_START=70 /DNA_END=1650 /DNA_ORIENTATION=+